MRRNKRALLAAIGIGALVLTGAAAFTASVSFTNTNTVLGYGAQTVTGGTVTAMTYTLGNGGTEVTAVQVVVNDAADDNFNTTGQTVSIGFNGAGTPSTCTFSSFSTPSNTYNCTGLTQSTNAITSTDITIT